MTTLRTATQVIGMSVKGADGATLGRIDEIMIDCSDGGVAFVVLAVGGVFGIGERLFALPWRLLRVDAEGVTAGFSLADLGDRRGFDKDAWPSEADPFFDEMP